MALGRLAPPVHTPLRSEQILNRQFYLLVRKCT